jgi:general nucleoside transport system ATP-binding protein
VSGNGQKELLAALSGEMLSGRPETVLLMDTPAGHLDPAQRRALGLGFVPEERLGRGAVPELSLADNALLTGSHSKLANGGMVRHGMIRRQAVRSFARDVIGRFKVKSRSEQSVASSLSGGNLQKFIVGRETMLGPQVIVVAQPTWGVDVGASMLIRQSLVDLRDSGVAVLVISEELDELFMICDRLAVIAEGRLSPPVPSAQTSIEQIGAWMGGQFAGNEEAAHA